MGKQKRKQDETVLDNPAWQRSRERAARQQVFEDDTVPIEEKERLLAENPTWEGIRQRRYWQEMHERTAQEADQLQQEREEYEERVRRSLRSERLDDAGTLSDERTPEEDLRIEGIIRDKFLRQGPLIRAREQELFAASRFSLTRDNSEFRPDPNTVAQRWASRAQEMFPDDPETQQQFIRQGEGAMDVYYEIPAPQASGIGSLGGSPVLKRAGIARNYDPVTGVRVPLQLPNGARVIKRVPKDRQSPMQIWEAKRNEQNAQIAASNAVHNAYRNLNDPVVVRDLLRAGWTEEAIANTKERLLNTPVFQPNVPLLSSVPPDRYWENPSDNVLGKFVMRDLVRPALNVVNAAARVPQQWLQPSTWSERSSETSAWIPFPEVAKEREREDEEARKAGYADVAMQRWLDPQSPTDRVSSTFVDALMIAYSLALTGNPYTGSAAAGLASRHLGRQLVKKYGAAALGEMLLPAAERTAASTLLRGAARNTIRLAATHRLWQDIWVPGTTGYADMNLRESMAYLADKGFDASSMSDDEITNFANKLARRKAENQFLQNPMQALGYKGTSPISRILAHGIDKGLRTIFSLDPNPRETDAKQLLHYARKLTANANEADRQKYVEYFSNFMREDVEVEEAGKSRSWAENIMTDAVSMMTSMGPFIMNIRAVGGQQIGLFDGIRRFITNKRAIRAGISPAFLRQAGMMADNAYSGFWRGVKEPMINLMREVPKWGVASLSGHGPAILQEQNRLFNQLVANGMSEGSALATSVIFPFMRSTIEYISEAGYVSSGIAANVLGTSYLRNLGRASLRAAFGETWEEQLADLLNFEMEEMTNLPEYARVQPFKPLLAGGTSRDALEQALGEAILCTLAGGGLGAARILGRVGRNPMAASRMFVQSLRNSGHFLQKLREELKEKYKIPEATLDTMSPARMQAEYYGREQGESFSPEAIDVMEKVLSMGLFEGATAPQIAQMIAHEGAHLTANMNLDEMWEIWKKSQRDGIASSWRLSKADLRMLHQMEDEWQAKQTLEENKTAATSAAPPSETPPSSKISPMQEPSGTEEQTDQDDSADKAESLAMKFLESLSEEEAEMLFKMTAEELEEETKSTYEDSPRIKQLIIELAAQKRNQAKAAEGKPAEGKPAEAKPAEKKPSEPKKKEASAAVVRARMAEQARKETDDIRKLKANAALWRAFIRNRNQPERLREYEDADLALMERAILQNVQAVNLNGRLSKNQPTSVEEIARLLEKGRIVLVGGERIAMGDLLEEKGETLTAAISEAVEGLPSQPDEQQKPKRTRTRKQAAKSTAKVQPESAESAQMPEEEAPAEEAPAEEEMGSSRSRMFARMQKERTAKSRDEDEDEELDDWVPEKDAEPIDELKEMETASVMMLSAQEEERLEELRSLRRLRLEKKKIVRKVERLSHLLDSADDFYPSLDSPAGNDALDVPRSEHDAPIMSSMGTIERAVAFILHFNKKFPGITIDVAKTLYDKDGNPVRGFSNGLHAVVNWSRGLLSTIPHEMSEVLLRMFNKSVVLGKTIHKAMDKYGAGLSDYDAMHNVSVEMSRYFVEHHDDGFIKKFSLNFWNKIKTVFGREDVAFTLYRVLETGKLPMSFSRAAFGVDVALDKPGKKAPKTAKQTIARLEQLTDEVQEEGKADEVAGFGVGNLIGRQFLSHVRFRLMKEGLEIPAAPPVDEAEMRRIITQEDSTQAIADLLEIIGATGNKKAERIVAKFVARNRTAREFPKVNVQLESGKTVIISTDQNGVYLDEEGYTRSTFETPPNLELFAKLAEFLEREKLATPEGISAPYFRINNLKVLYHKTDDNGKSRKVVTDNLGELADTPEYREVTDELAKQGFVLLGPAGKNDSYIGLCVDLRSVTRDHLLRYKDILARTYEITEDPEVKKLMTRVNAYFQEGRVREPLTPSELAIIVRTLFLYNSEFGSQLLTLGEKIFKYMNTLAAANEPTFMTHRAVEMLHRAMRGEYLPPSSLERQGMEDLLTVIEPALTPLERRGKVRPDWSLADRIAKEMPGYSLFRGGFIAKVNKAGVIDPKTVQIVTVLVSDKEGDGRDFLSPGMALLFDWAFGENGEANSHKTRAYKSADSVETPGFLYKGSTKTATGALYEAMRMAGIGRVITDTTTKIHDKKAFTIDLTSDEKPPATLEQFVDAILTQYPEGMLEGRIEPRIILMDPGKITVAASNTTLQRHTVPLGAQLFNSTAFDSITFPFATTERAYNAVVDMLKEFGRRFDAASRIVEEDGRIAAGIMLGQMKDAQWSPIYDKIVGLLQYAIQGNGSNIIPYLPLMTRATNGGLHEALFNLLYAGETGTVRVAGGSYLNLLPDDGLVDGENIRAVLRGGYLEPEELGKLFDIQDVVEYSKIAQQLQLSEELIASVAEQIWKLDTHLKYKYAKTEKTIAKESAAIAYRDAAIKHLARRKGYVHTNLRKGTYFLKGTGRMKSRLADGSIPVIVDKHMKRKAGWTVGRKVMLVAIPTDAPHNGMAGTIVGFSTLKDSVSIPNEIARGIGKDFDGDHLAVWSHSEGYWDRQKKLHRSRKKAAETNPELAGKIYGEEEDSDEYVELMATSRYGEMSFEHFTAIWEHFNNPLVYGYIDSLYREAGFSSPFTPETSAFLLANGFVKRKRSRGKRSHVTLVGDQQVMADYVGATKSIIGSVVSARKNIQFFIQAFGKKYIDLERIDDYTVNAEGDKKQMRAIDAVHLAASLLTHHAADVPKEENLFDYTFDHEKFVLSSIDELLKQELFAEGKGQDFLAEVQRLLVFVTDASKGKITRAKSGYVYSKTSGDRIPGQKRMEILRFIRDEIRRQGLEENPLTALVSDLGEVPHLHFSVDGWRQAVHHDILPYMAKALGFTGVIPAATLDSEIYGTAEIFPFSEESKSAFGYIRWKARRLWRDKIAEPETIEAAKAARVLRNVGMVNFFELFMHDRGKATSRQRQIATGLGGSAGEDFMGIPGRPRSYAPKGFFTDYYDTGATYHPFQYIIPMMLRNLNQAAHGISSKVVIPLTVRPFPGQPNLTMTLGLHNELGILVRKEDGWEEYTEGQAAEDFSPLPPGTKNKNDEEAKHNIVRGQILDALYEAAWLIYTDNGTRQNPKALGYKPIDGINARQRYDIIKMIADDVLVDRDGNPIETKIATAIRLILQEEYPYRFEPIVWKETSEPKDISAKLAGADSRREIGVRGDSIKSGFYLTHGQRFTSPYAVEAGMPYDTRYDKEGPTDYSTGGESGRSESVRASERMKSINAEGISFMTPRMFELYKEALEQSPRIAALQSGHVVMHETDVDVGGSTEEVLKKAIRAAENAVQLFSHVQNLFTNPDPLEDPQAALDKAEAMKEALVNAEQQAADVYRLYRELMQRSGKESPEAAELMGQLRELEVEMRDMQALAMDSPGIHTAKQTMEKAEGLGRRVARFFKTHFITGSLGYYQPTLRQVYGEHLRGTTTIGPAFTLRIKTPEGIPGQKGGASIFVHDLQNLALRLGYAPLGNMDYGGMPVMDVIWSVAQQIKSKVTTDRRFLAEYLAQLTPFNAVSTIVKRGKTKMLPFYLSYVWDKDNPRDILSNGLAFNRLLIRELAAGKYFRDLRYQQIRLRSGESYWGWSTGYSKEGKPYVFLDEGDPALPTDELDVIGTSAELMDYLVEAAPELVEKYGKDQAIFFLRSLIQVRRTISIWYENILSQGLQMLAYAEEHKIGSKHQQSYFKSLGKEFRSLLRSIRTGAHFYPVDVMDQPGLVDKMLGKEEQSISSAAQSKVALALDTFSAKDDTLGENPTREAILRSQILGGFQLLRECFVLREAEAFIDQVKQIEDPQKAWNRLVEILSYNTRASRGFLNVRAEVDTHYKRNALSTDLYDYGSDEKSTFIDIQKIAGRPDRTLHDPFTLLEPDCQESLQRSFGELLEQIGDLGVTILDAGYVQPIRRNPVFSEKAAAAITEWDRRRAGVWNLKVWTPLGKPYRAADNGTGIAEKVSLSRLIPGENVSMDLEGEWLIEYFEGQYSYEGLRSIQMRYIKRVGDDYYFQGVLQGQIHELIINSTTMKVRNAAGGRAFSSGTRQAQMLRLVAKPESLRTQVRDVGRWLERRLRQSGGRNAALYGMYRWQGYIHMLNRMLSIGGGVAKIGYNFASLAGNVGYAVVHSMWKLGTASDVFKFKELMLNSSDKKVEDTLRAVYHALPIFNWEFITQQVALGSSYEKSTIAAFSRSMRIAMEAREVAEEEATNRGLQASKRHVFVTQKAFHSWKEKMAEHLPFLALLGNARHVENIGSIAYNWAYKLFQKSEQMNRQMAVGMAFLRTNQFMSQKYDLDFGDDHRQVSFSELPIPIQRAITRSQATMALQIDESINYNYEMAMRPAWLRQPYAQFMFKFDQFKMSSYVWRTREARDAWRAFKLGKTSFTYGGDPLTLSTIRKRTLDRKLEIDPSIVSDEQWDAFVKMLLTSDTEESRKKAIAAIKEQMASGITLHGAQLNPMMRAISFGMASAFDAAIKGYLGWSLLMREPLTDTAIVLLDWLGDLFGFFDDDDDEFANDPLMKQLRNEKLQSDLRTIQMSSPIPGGLIASQVLRLVLLGIMAKYNPDVEIEAEKELDDAFQNIRQISGVKNFIDVIAPIAAREGTVAWGVILRQLGIRRTSQEAIEDRAKAIRRERLQLLNEPVVEGGVVRTSKYSPLRATALAIQRYLGRPNVIGQEFMGSKYGAEYGLPLVGGGKEHEYAETDDPSTLSNEDATKWQEYWAIRAYLGDRNAEKKLANNHVERMTRQWLDEGKTVDSEVKAQLKIAAEKEAKTEIAEMKEKLEKLEIPRTIEGVELATPTKENE